MIYIYNGPGVSKLGIEHLEKLFTQESIQLISFDDVLEGTWTKDAMLFVMPGGADIPYTEKLNGHGNTIINDYVKKGGFYLGICAGAYYASQYLEFAKGTDREVVGYRELSFFPGTVQGPTFSPYHYGNYKGARAVAVEWQFDHKLALPIFYNGGGHFIDAAMYSDVKVLGTYADLPNQPAAVIECAVGKGKAVLSGVHFEYDSSLLDRDDPHLECLIPILEKHEEERVEVVEKLLERSGGFTL